MLSEEKIEAIVTARLAGGTIEEISLQLGHAKETVRKYVYGIERGQIKRSRPKSGPYGGLEGFGPKASIPPVHSRHSPTGHRRRGGSFGR
jgi:hypothetical protein